ncbi:FAD-dependent oxidoreductase [Bradyrhizobium sp. INPA01-394B]|uniref:FAD-dependent oxidoreductase n=1 Tax=Bradyrhizobium campsiandrae TaxID=1729892 RepID=A0ABR7UL19_9BRAD|nr:FAD-dependent oxidoreductase [Bradyrhizobium campsiandrae]MBC9882680.1 FAD-dependent oxidoreductase [Bradyrhizobium campsiandrae]MBC9984137.1 FAD-dependent oxidoreductase [Bradyrhizobium campsiandrae]
MAKTDIVDCDLLVIGSGAGGLAAAVTGASLGLDVLLIEKDTQLGGTTAWSGGWMWIPRNPLAQAAGIVENPEQPRRYLRHELAEGYDPARIEMFLDQGPRMIDFFQRETRLAFIDGNQIPDFHGNSPGAVTGGRSVCAAPFDGRELGARIRDLRPPLEEVSPFGMGIASGADLRHFLNASSSLGSFLHVARRLARHFCDLLRFGRGMHLANGNALVARLLKSADELGVRIMTATPARSLSTEGSRVVGAHAGQDGKVFDIRARRGVVLACGGFPHDVARKAALFAHAPSGREHWSAAPESNTGDGIRLGETIGGRLRTDLSDTGAWAPVSLVPHQGGSVGRFPHLIERAKPGLIMVRKDGLRFVNEADSYHDVMKALFAATPAGEPAEAWAICDTAFIKRYGLGRVRPSPFPIRPWLRNGYLKRGNSVPALARACGIASAAFETTIADYNASAARGEDPAFGRGNTPYNRVQGEAAHQPNPCVAPIEAGPFYAVKIVAGSLGTFAGLDTDEHARVLDGEKKPIEGLYAVGNDMSSIMAGRYPSGGITLGPAMTFGYIAAHHAGGIPLENNRSAAA